MISSAMERRRGPASETPSPRSISDPYPRAIGSFSTTPATRRRLSASPGQRPLPILIRRDKEGKLYAVDVVPVRKLKQPVTLAAIKADKSFATFALTRVPRLSVMPVTDDQWERIEGMAR